MVQLGLLFRWPLGLPPREHPFFQLPHRLQNADMWRALATDQHGNVGAFDPQGAGYRSLTDFKFAFQPFKNLDKFNLARR